MNKRYVAARQKSERNQHGEIVRNGSHSSQKVINALVLLNSDEGQINEPPRFDETIAGVLQIRQRKAERVEIALGGQQGKWCFYERKANGEFEALMAALSSSAYSQWALWLLVQRAVEFDYINKISYQTLRRD